MIDSKPGVYYSPYALWKLAAGDRGEYVRLMKEHGHLIPTEPIEDYLPEMALAKIPYMVQALIFVWEPDHGWLHTRSGISSHLPPGDEEERFLFEMKLAYRAVRSALDKADLRRRDE